MSQVIQALDLFAGAGGLSLGLRKANIHSVAAVEINPAAAATYAAHLPETRVLLSNVAHLDLRSYAREIELVVGGPPCQPFSSGGMREASNDLRDMVPWYVEAIRVVQPRAFLFENVPGLTIGIRKNYFLELLKSFENLGYRVVWKIINAADYGVPQMRKRLFIVGMQDRAFVFPRPTHGPTTAEPYVSVNDVLPNYPIGEPNHSKVFYARNPHLRPNPLHGLLFNGGGRPIDRSQPAPTILASAGGNKTHFFDELGLVPEYHRYLLSGGSPKVGHLPGARRLSVLESAILQSFSADIHFSGTQSAQYEQVGNAVPPLLASMLGKTLAEQIAGIRGRNPTAYFPSQPAALFPKEVLEESSHMGKSIRNKAVEEAVNCALERIDAYIGGDPITLPSAKHRRVCDELLSKQKSSIRVAVLFLVFYRLKDPHWDLKSIPVGARGAYGDKKLGESLNQRHLTLSGTTVAWGENLGSKGSVRTFDLSKDPRFKDFYEMADATVEEQYRIADYIAYRFAQSQKLPEPLPPLAPYTLTFPRAKILFGQVLNLPTEGHVQQFLITALLYDFRKKQSIDVVTHHPHAADKFDNAAGDIEEFVDGKLLRAYEVTVREDWKNRLSSFAQKMRRFGLTKYIILARGVNQDTEWSEPASMALRLEGIEQDIAVVDISDAINFLAADLTAIELKDAVNRTYSYLANPKLSGRQDFMDMYKQLVENWLDTLT